MPERKRPAGQKIGQPETFAELVERLRPPDEAGRHRRAPRRPVAGQSPHPTALATSDTAPLALAWRTSRTRIAQVTMISTVAAAIMLAVTYEIGAERASKDEVPAAQRMTPAPTVSPPTSTTPSPPLIPSPVPAPASTAVSQTQRPATASDTPATAAGSRPKQRPGTTGPNSSVEPVRQPRVTDPLPAMRCERGRARSPKWLDQRDHQLCVWQDEDDGD